jgi:beta-N-acetylhexosaminidase
MTLSKERWIDDLLGRMNLEQKVGQMLVFGFAGPVITPDIIDLIQNNHLGGLRISLKFRSQTLLHDLKPGTTPDENILRSLQYPQGNNRDYADPKQCIGCTPQEYATVLNRLRDYALERDLGIPLHFTIDQEGNGSDDLINGQRLFPHPMGLVASGDPELAYRVALAIGKQARAIGANMIHSPVLDVNTNPWNPEISTRAYSDEPAEVIRYALQSLRGFQETGLVATGKHFPGRGESVADAHWGLPSMDVDLETMQRVHLTPFKALIEAGLPAILTAHCQYPALGVTDDPGSVSKRVIQDLLRGELGFKGVITTDNMMMGGILQRYEIREAVVRTIMAGHDLLLYRDESSQRVRIIEAVLKAVRDGRIPESQIDTSVARILDMRWNMGLHNKGGKVIPEQATTPINDAEVIQTARDAAEKSVMLLRDEQNLLPLKPTQKILLVEQVFSTHQMANNLSCHPGMLWEEMCRESSNAGSVEIPMLPPDHDRERILRRLDEAEIIVTTNYYYHKAAATMTDLVREIHQAGKPVVVISNNPFEMAAPPDFPTVIVVFTAGGRENLQAAVRIMFGKLTPSAETAT